MSESNKEHEPSSAERYAAAQDIRRKADSKRLSRRSVDAQLEAAAISGVMNFLQPVRNLEIAALEGENGLIFFKRFAAPVKYDRIRFAQMLEQKLGVELDPTAQSTKRDGIVTRRLGILNDVPLYVREQPTRRGRISSLQLITLNETERGELPTEELPIIDADLQPTDEHTASYWGRIARSSMEFFGLGPHDDEPT